MIGVGISLRFKEVGNEGDSSHKTCLVGQEKVLSKVEHGLGSLYKENLQKFPLHVYSSYKGVLLDSVCISLSPFQNVTIRKKLIRFNKGVARGVFKSTGVSLYHHFSVLMDVHPLGTEGVCDDSLEF